jgi:hypothetical protein
MSSFLELIEIPKPSFNFHFAKMDLIVNPLNAELNPICHLLALLGAHPILHVSRIRVKLRKMLNEGNVSLR